MKARAVVTVQIEVDIEGTWGDECTVAQVHNQAKTEALQTLDHVLKGNAVSGGALQELRNRVRLVPGSMRARAVIDSDTGTR